MFLYFESSLIDAALSAADEDEDSDDMPADPDPDPTTDHPTHPTSLICLFFLTTSGSNKMDFLPFNDKDPVSSHIFNLIRGFNEKCKTEYGSRLFMWGDQFYEYTYRPTSCFSFKFNLYS